MVFDQGKLVEFDKPEVLFANKDSIFYSMALSAGITQNQINSSSVVFSL